MSSTSAESSFSASEGTSSQATPETSDVFSEITEFFTENKEIFIKTGIGTGGFLLGIILMLIVSKCKRKKETEVSNTSNNGVITNGRTQEEMDSLLQKYINDANTMKKQWQNTSSQIYTSQQHASYVEDDLPLQSMDIVHISHQESTVNYPSANEQVPQSEYTNSGVVQSYRDEDINGANEGTARGENYFLLQKDFVEINGMHNETVPHGYSADNYFLLEKDFVEGTDLQDLEDQSQFTVM